MCKSETVKEYLDAGMNLTLLNGKKPVLGDWTSRTVDPDSILAHDGNLGMVVRDGDLVVDVDPKNGGLASFEALCSVVGPLEKTVMTPSGGFHCYLRGMPSGKVRKGLRDYPGIDFLGVGSQCVIASSRIGEAVYAWADEDFGMFEQAQVPPELVALVSRGEYVSTGSETVTGLTAVDDEEDDPFDDLVVGSTMSEDQVLAYLTTVDPGIGNDEWVKVGMALHNWDQVDGLRLWENWSQGGDNWAEGETEKRWRSFDEAGVDGVTMGTLVHMAQEGSLVASVTGRDQWSARIMGAASENTLRGEVLVSLRSSTLGEDDREFLAVMVQRKLHGLTTVKPGIKQCRDLVRGKVQRMGNDGAPGWCSDWVYVNSHNAFVHVDNLQELNAAAFNLKCGSLVPAGENGHRISAARYVSEGSYVRLVDTKNYLPQFPNDSVVKKDGRLILNTFDPRTVPATASEFSEAGLAAIGAVEKHLQLLANDAAAGRILTEWLAFQVQYPGRQILWAPVIQGIQGVGKTWVAELLRTVLGSANVGVVSPSVVVGDFNDWAVGTQVNVLEELRLQGRNRYDAVNALKPMITDSTFQVNPKGVRAYLAYGVANYICFTNFKDALPLDATDRRWWVVFCEVESLDEFGDGYFDDLWQKTKKFGPELRKWLLDYPISDEFMATKRAPMTTHKEAMVATEEASTEGYSELKELIEIGSAMYNSKVVCSSDLFDALIMEFPELDIGTNKRAFLLKRLGYLKHQKRVKVEGILKGVWTRGIMSPDEIRKSLKGIKVL
jgi:hypothetical protein